MVSRIDRRLIENDLDVSGQTGDDTPESKSRTLVAPPLKTAASTGSSDGGLPVKKGRARERAHPLISPGLTIGARITDFVRAPGFHGP